MEKTINARQFAVIIFIVGVAAKIFMLPALLLSMSGRDSYIPLIIYLIAEAAILVLIILTIKKQPDLNLYQLMEKTMGKVLPRIILAVIAVFFLIKTTLLISETKIFFTVTATQNLSWLVCILPLLVMFAVITLKTLRDIGRLSEFMAPVIILSMFIMACIMFKSAELKNIFPILENGGSGILFSLKKLSLWMSDFSVLTIFIGQISGKKRLMRMSLISCAISFLIVLFFNITMFAAYGNISKLLDYGHNITNMTVYSLGSYNYGRFDIVIFCIWFIAILIQIAVLFYSAARHIEYVAGIKNKYISAMLMLILQFVLTAFVFHDDQKLYSYASSVFNYFTFFAEFIFPLVLFAAASLLAHSRKRKRRALLNEPK